MSAAAKQTGEVISAEESKGYFEVGTEGLVEYFAEIAAATDPVEVAEKHKAFLKDRVEDFRLEASNLRERIAEIRAIKYNPEDSEDMVFIDKKASLLDQLEDELANVQEQIEYFTDEITELANIPEDQLAGIKANAQAFIDNRTKILAKWDENYQANPLMIVQDIDGEPVTVTTDGRDLSTWVNEMLSKSLG